MCFATRVLPAAAAVTNKLKLLERVTSVESKIFASISNSLQRDQSILLEPRKVGGEPSLVQRKRI
jgi:hypothetical protein